MRAVLSVSVDAGRICKREGDMNIFEIAQVANLTPNDADEAKSLIPTYARPASPV